MRAEAAKNHEAEAAPKASAITGRKRSPGDAEIQAHDEGNGESDVDQIESDLKQQPEVGAPSSER
jgi:hypothetical protein